MKNLIKKLICGLIYRLKLFRIAKFNVRILAFHIVNPKYFEQQIKHLVKYYNIIPLSQIFSNNKNSVVLTFDDGYKNNLEYAYPILKKYNAPATLFVAYDFIESNTFTWWDRIEYSGKKADLKELKTSNPNEIEERVVQLTGLTKTDKKTKQYDFMSWDELKKINDVFEIGSHTISHPILTNISLDEAEREVSESKVKIEKKIGEKLVSFAYPNGNFNDAISKLVHKAGYKFAVIYDKGNIMPKTNPFKLYRRGINVNDDLWVFVVKVAGFF